MHINVTKEELYTMIKDAVREVIGEKEISHLLHSLQEVSNSEMSEIIEKYGSPDQYTDVAFSETIDL
ncbi:MAG: hypothetical protein WDA74_02250 [Spirochaetota bacterium]